MIPKPLNQIKLADLQALVGVARESKTLEFKMKMPGNADGDMVPFLAGVSSFANSSGGDFVIGIAAQDGIPESIPGVTIVNLDAETLRFEQLFANGLEPRLPRVEIQAIPCAEGRHVLIVRTARSWVGPHRVRKNDKFYGRNSGGRYPLDVGELRNAFSLSEAAVQRIRAFRTERLSKILSGEALVKPPAIMVLHVLPLPAFADQRLIDIVSEISRGYEMPLPLDGPSGLNQVAVNLDGLTNFATNPPSGINSYAQLFRSGAIEGASGLSHAKEGHRYFVGTRLANMIVAAIQNYIRVTRSLDVGFPLFACLSLCGAKGVRLRYVGPDGLWYDSQPVNDDVISLPEIAIEYPDADVTALMRPLFNILWNAFGFMRSEMYSEDGKWVAK